MNKIKSHLLPTSLKKDKIHISESRTKLLFTQTPPLLAWSKLTAVFLKMSPCKFSLLIDNGDAALIHPDTSGSALLGRRITLFRLPEYVLYVIDKITK
jgi:hypothetical protein